MLFGKRPLLSVIIPAYNEESYLAACLTSVFHQDLESSQYEVIVVDNASTDRTAKIAKTYPVRFYSEPRRSVVLARQKAVDHSRGRIIVSADADTVYPKNWLRLIAASFTRHPDLTALVGWVYFTGTPFWFNFSIALSQKFNLLLAKTTGQFPIVYAANFAFQKEALKVIGGYPVHLPELGDQQYLLYKMQKLGQIMIHPRVYCHTSSRRHGGHLHKIILYNGWYRLIGYTLNRLTGRQVIGPAPAVRLTPVQKSRSGHQIL